MDRRVLKTKEAIQSAFFKLIEENKTTKITITNIAKMANIDRKTFYLHYNSPTDIIVEFCSQKTKEFFEHLESEDFFDQPLDTQNVFHAIYELIEKDLQLYQTLASHPVYDAFWEQFKELCVQNAIEAYSKKLPISQLALDIYVEYVFSGVLAIYRRYLKEKKYNLEEVSKILNEVTFHGLTPILHPEEN
jgi:AcrR family transcriptional regulator